MFIKENNNNNNNWGTGYFVFNLLLSPFAWIAFFIVVQFYLILPRIYLCQWLHNDTVMAKNFC